MGNDRDSTNFLDKGVSSIAVATIRSAIGGGLLLVAVVLLRKISFRTWSWKWTILAAASIALFQGLFYIHPSNGCSNWNRCDNWECPYVFRHARVVILENTPL